MKYTSTVDTSDSMHVWLSACAEDGSIIATSEHWCGSEIEKDIKRMEKHQAVPGRMIPLGDPRWYAYCQWCGESIEGQHAAYLVGQWHLPDCYKHALKK